MKRRHWIGQVLLSASAQRLVQRAPDGLWFPSSLCISQSSVALQEVGKCPFANLKMSVLHCAKGKVCGLFHEFPICLQRYPYTKEKNNRTGSLIQDLCAFFVRTKGVLPC